MAALDPLKKAAIYAMSLADEGGDVAKVVSKADDWGWKGGKPGEITGGEFSRTPINVPAYKYGDELDEDVGDIVYDVLERKGIDESDPRYWDVWDDTYEGLSPLTNETVMKAYKQISPSLPNVETAYDVNRIMEDFQALEQADIPREWTGKVMKALGGSIRVPGQPGSTFMQRQRYAHSISDAMRPMTNDQRETFLALLPEWEGSLDDLAEAAGSL